MGFKSDRLPRTAPRCARLLVGFSPTNEISMIAKYCKYATVRCAHFPYHWTMVRFHDVQLREFDASPRSSTCKVHGVYPTSPVSWVSQHWSCSMFLPKLYLWWQYITAFDFTIFYLHHFASMFMYLLLQASCSILSTVSPNMVFDFQADWSDDAVE